MMLAAYTLPLLVLSTLSFGVLAHDDPGSRINVLTDRIAQRPADATLYLARARLWRLDGHHEAAVRDFERASELHRDLRDVEYLHGLTLLETGKAAQAMAHLDRYLLQNPNKARARAARARALVVLGDHSLAVADFTRAIKQLPNPDYYRERARAQANAGNLQSALRGLDDGVSRLGPLASLLEMAIELALETGDFDAALVRLERAHWRHRRPDIWQAKRGAILLQAGRQAEARQAFEQALSAMESLPNHRRTSRNAQRQRTHLRSTLQMLSVATPGEIPRAAQRQSNGVKSTTGR